MREWEWDWTWIFPRDDFVGRRTHVRGQCIRRRSFAFLARRSGSQPLNAVSNFASCLLAVIAFLWESTVSHGEC